MRALVYLIAVSMDGYIADPDGGFDGFGTQPETLAALFELYPETCPAHARAALGVTAAARRFDAVVMGYRTHQPALDAGLTSAYPHLKQYVVTHRALPDDPTVETISGDAAAAVAELKTHPGRDIWLCGGADLAGQLIGLVDEIQLKVNPVLFGSGIPLVRLGYASRPFTLVGTSRLPGDVLLNTYRPAQGD